jgi:NAD(P)-dependent dehydrogenase (short-subunit alcohol dehydrogenase family)
LYVGGGSWFSQVVLATEQPTVLITGASRGLGFEFTRQYADKGWTVIATCRSPSEANSLHALAAGRTNVTIEEMDVTDSTEIDALAEKYQDVPIDVLINNAGIFGYENLQTLDVLDYDTFTQVMAVNVYGPLKVSQAFAKSVADSEQKKIVTLTTGLGSMTLTDQIGGYYFYRASKAGANIIGRALAADLRDEGILIGLFNPGIVNTDFLKWTTYDGPTIEPEEAVANLIHLIEGLNEEHNAIMINYDGTPMPW